LNWTVIGADATHFCLGNPRLRITVYNLPTARPFAWKTIRQFHARK
jgi:hypothetical protein